MPATSQERSSAIASTTKSVKVYSPLTNLWRNLRRRDKLQYPTMGAGRGSSMGRKPCGYEARSSWMYRILTGVNACLAGESMK